MFTMSHKNGDTQYTLPALAHSYFSNVEAGKADTISSAELIKSTRAVLTCKLRE